MNQSIVLGPPGTGKTTFLLGEVEKALAQGVPVDRIGFLAFTKKAATEAKDRAVRKFNLPYRDFPYFRTLHSLALQEIGMSRGNVMSYHNWQELGNILGLQLKGFVNPEDGIVGNQQGDDRLVFLENLSRVRMVSLDEQWNEAYYDDISWAALERFATGLKRYKENRYLIDYTDMIYRFLERGKGPKLELLVIDEAQDLSELQWRMVDILRKNSARVLIAGDDDQAIFKWAGASLERFLGLEGQTLVLDRSYRIPKQVHDLATSISDRIGARRVKQFEPRQEQGSVQYHDSINNVDMSEGHWLVLARNKYILDKVVELCDAEGYYYGGLGFKNVEPELIQAIRIWEEKRQSKAEFTPEEVDLLINYAKKKNLENRELIWHEAFTKMAPERRARIVGMLRRGEKITQEPRIKLSTIHGAKGGEADNVVVFLDVSYKAFQESQRNPDDELRVLYVAVTRAKKCLHIIEPETNLHFDI